MSYSIIDTLLYTSIPLCNLYYRSCSHPRFFYSILSSNHLHALPLPHRSCLILIVHISSLTRWWWMVRSSSAIKPTSLDQSTSLTRSAQTSKVLCTSYMGTIELLDQVFSICFPWLSMILWILSSVHLSPRTRTCVMYGWYGSRTIAIRWCDMPM